jgi:methylenetetrahydrofolate reductase (NADPH)
MSATPTDTQTASPGELAACAADLVACGSLEMSPDRVGDVGAVAASLPVGTKVYVNHLPRHALAGGLPTLDALRRAGLEPVPHVAARRVLSRPELRSFLERAAGGRGERKCC